MQNHYLHQCLTDDLIFRQARGDDSHNLVTIVMHERKCDLISALEWISDLHDGLVKTFLSTLKKVPSFGEQSLDNQVATYVDGLGNWVRANDTWSFEVRHMLFQL